ncbi:MAG: AAA family ATPase [Acidobacteriota bacterium]|nr:AAA family ATPase [Acidobacteriota bacterium]
MRLQRARVRNYRSIKDSGWFDVDPAKTILVGPNEGGKTAVLRALEQLNPGHFVRSFDPLRDFPRSEYHRIQSGELRPSDVVVVEGEYELDDSEREELAAISPALVHCRYSRAVRLDNSVSEQLLGAPQVPTAGELVDHLRRIAAFVDSRQQVATAEEGADDPLAVLNSPVKASEKLEQILATIGTADTGGKLAEELIAWIDTDVVPHVDPGNADQTADLAGLRASIGSVDGQVHSFDFFRARLPVMVYVATYPSVTPMLHLGHLAEAIESGAVDESDEYNFGNLCLLSLLGFSARQLSDMGRAKEPESGDFEGFERFRAQLDERDAALAAASLKLTNHIRTVWQPGVPDDEAGHDSGRPDYAIRVTADQQYLKVVVEDALGVQIELDQRSHGFRWLVSFFVVFFAQASERDKRAVLLLDEPGLSLHGLKQRDFRRTLSKLGETSQLLFTTHSPFLVGTDELDRVRVVELADRATGTKVHGGFDAEDPASILPLREALAYDLASSLFSGRKVFILESLTDFWYLEATATLLADAGMAALDNDIELLPVGSLARIAYFSTFLHAEGLGVAALLDGDVSSELAEQQEALVEKLGDRRVLRTKDVYSGPVGAPRIEELLRETLVTVGKELGWDVTGGAGMDWGGRPVDEVFAAAGGVEFTPYRLAKEYVKWTRDHRASDLAADERIMWMRLIEKVNQSFS